MTSTTEAAVPLSAAGRRSRLAAAAVVFGLLVVGAFFGSDDHFPLGPFRMYATSSQSTGQVAVVALQVKTEGSDWTLVRPSPESVGMNVAEFEGQLPRFEDDPALLSAVAFAVMHFEPQRLLVLVTIGAGLGIVRWRTGSLGACIVAHAVNNLPGAIGILLLASGTG